MIETVHVIAVMVAALTYWGVLAWLDREAS